MGSKPMVALSLAVLPGDTGKVILAMGGLDQKIYIYLGKFIGKVSIVLFCFVYCVFYRNL